MKHLANELYDALRKNSSEICVVDCSLDESIRLTKKQVLIIATALSKQLKSKSSKRIGIAIPSSGIGLIVNLAVLFANKIPVNINFANSKETSEYCLRKAGIGCVLTIRKVMQKFPNFPWPTNTIDCLEKIKAIKSCKKTLISNAITNFVPKIISKHILEIPSQATNEECALLFTSGSSGQPKGVVLTHDNILSNCEGIALVGNFPSNSRILANLPLFHSFGFTVTLWFSLLNNIRIINVPSPLEINKTIKAIEDEQATVLLGTPTFLGGYLRKGSSNKFKSLQYVIAGAEKSKLDFIKQWENLAECTYLEGYGLTETSPVLSLNSPQHGIKHGTVGRLLPNIKVKTIHPDTHENLKMHQSGILCFQGPNIFKEYLGDKEKTKATFKDGWFVTGDIGKLDEQGFIVIEGRLSRFSKIGGEMIPHETIEAEANEILGWQNDEMCRLIITAKPHETKGEELILITSENINFDKLKQKLSEKFSNLFVPKIHIKIKSIPMLPTGKLDFQSIQKLVK